MDMLVDDKCISLVDEVCQQCNGLNPLVRQGSRRSSTLLSEKWRQVDRRGSVLSTTGMSVSSGTGVPAAADPVGGPDETPYDPFVNGRDQALEAELNRVLAKMKRGTVL